VVVFWLWVISIRIRRSGIEKKAGIVDPSTLRGPERNAGELEDGNTYSHTSSWLAMSSARAETQQKQPTEHITAPRPMKKTELRKKQEIRSTLLRI